MGKWRTVASVVMVGALVWTPAPVGASAPETGAAIRAVPAQTVKGGRQIVPLPLWAPLGWTGQALPAQAVMGGRIVPLPLWAPPGWTGQTLPAQAVMGGRQAVLLPLWKPPAGAAAIQA